jgi:hypothetical protein
MSHPSFILPLEFTDDITSIETDQNGLIIIFEDQNIVTMKCDRFTAYYYQNKLSYELMYKQSNNKAILDDLISKFNTDQVIGVFDCDYGTLKDDINVLTKYLICIQDLKDFEQFVNKCEAVPTIVKERHGFCQIVCGAHKMENLLELTAKDLCKIINNNIRIKQSTMNYNMVIYTMAMILIAYCCYFY